MSAVLSDIEAERRGNSIAATRLCTIISSLVDLCITSEHNPHYPPSSFLAEPQVFTSSLCALALSVIVA